METLVRFGHVFGPEDKKIIEACEAFFKPFVDSTIIIKSTTKVLRKLKKKYKLGLVSDFLYSPALRNIAEV